MLYLQRISKVVIRIVILLLLVQFVTPAFAHVGTGDNTGLDKHSSSFSAKHESGITVSVFLKENSEEKNEADEKPHFSFELIDFSFVVVALKQSHSHVYWDTDNPQLLSGSLFKLFCVFLI